MPYNQDVILTRITSFFLPVSIMVTVWLHWQSLSGGFLSDTYAVYISCYNLQQDGIMWSSTLSMFWKGLSNGTVDVYRPLGFLSLCGEFSLFGNSPFILKSIQMAIHIVNAAVLYVLVKTLFTKNKNAEITAVFSAIFFLFSPVTPEVSMWIAARHDSLAHLFILLSCLFHWQNKKGLTFICVILALCSKESAILLPAMLFTMSYFKFDDVFKNSSDKIISAIKLTWMYWMLLILYMLLRLVLFDGALHVYEQQFSFIESILHNLTVFPKVFSFTALASWQGTSLYNWFWVVLFILMILSFVLSFKNNSKNKWLMFFAWIIITLFALISQIGSTDSSGAGARVLYTVSAWFSVIMVLPLLYLNRTFVCFYILLAVLLVYVQSLPIHQWTQAAMLSKKLLKSVDEIPALNDDKQWDLVLIPENIGVGLLGRTAQGGFSMPPFRNRNMLNEMIPFIGSDLEIWRNRLNNNFMKDYKTNVSNPDQLPQRYFCTNKLGNLVEVSIYNEDLITQEIWANKWKQQTSKLDCYL